MLQPTASNRLLSLDFLRGLIMVLLTLEASGLWGYLFDNTEGATLHPLFTQFTHHPWNGLHFWDLVQPSFMFMAGVAMAYSLYKQKLHELTWAESFRKILKRCWWL